MVEDASASTHLALATAVVMLAYLRHATLLLVLDTAVVADARAPAYLVLVVLGEMCWLAPAAVMLAYRQSAALLAYAL
jgi:hypothetical protein